MKLPNKKYFGENVGLSHWDKMSQNIFAPVQFFTISKSFALRAVS